MARGRICGAHLEIVLGMSSEHTVPVGVVKVLKRPQKELQQRDREGEGEKEGM